MYDLLWIALPFVVAVGSGLISFVIVQARMQVALAKQREDLVMAQATLAQQHKVTEERIKKAEAEARQKAFDEFLADVRVEERHYIRESQPAGGTRRSLVLQERIFFRHIPLSQWVEHELPMEDGSLSEPEEQTGRKLTSGSKLLR